MWIISQAAPPHSSPPLYRGRRIPVYLHHPCNNAGVIEAKQGCPRKSTSRFFSFSTVLSFLLEMFCSLLCLLCFLFYLPILSLFLFSSVFFYHWPHLCVILLSILHSFHFRITHPLLISVIEILLFLFSFSMFTSAHGCFGLRFLIPFSFSCLFLYFLNSLSSLTLWMLCCLSS